MCPTLPTHLILSLLLHSTVGLTASANEFIFLENVCFKRRKKERKNYDRKIKLPVVEVELSLWAMPINPNDSVQPKYPFSILSIAFTSIYFLAYIFNKQKLV